MRKHLGARLIFSLSAIAAIGVWVACGGSDPQDVVQTDAGTDTGSSTDKDTGTSNTDSGGTDATTDTKIPGFCDLNDCDAGTAITLDSGEDGGITCVVGGELELEPNDTRPVANELKPTRCGVVLADGGIGVDQSDFLTFMLADASTSFFLQYSGNIKVLVETDGQAPVDITQGTPTLSFVRGSPYYVEVKSSNNAKAVWRVTLFQK